MSALEGLVGAQLQRVDGPRPDLFALTLHRPGRTGALVIALREGGAAWDWVDRRPRGDPASAFVRQLRKHLENARVRAVEVHADGARLELSRGDASPVLHVAARPANLVLEIDERVAGAADVASLRRAGGDVGAPYPPAGAQGRAALDDTLEAMQDAGPELVAAVLGDAAATRRGALQKALKRRRKQLRRRLIAIEGDLDRVDQVAGLRARGDLLLANLHAIPKDAGEATVEDWTTGDPITIPIAEGRTAREEADALYRRARKLERGGKVALERHELTEAEIAAVDALLDALPTADDEALDALEPRARKLGARVQRSGARAARVERLPYRTFVSGAGRTILVGRSAGDNDRLTLGARPWDHWLHARGVTGSHVIIPLEKRETCPDGLLLDAAHLAAHYSAARGEPVVDVQHCPRRHVRKPKGFPPGAVRVEREKVLGLRIEPERLRRLLTDERV